MPFLPKVNDQIVIGSATFTFLPNPGAPRIVYGQTAGKATVYKVARRDGDDYALKVFQRQYSDPQVIVNTQRLSIYKALPGLRVCKRFAITPESDPNLVREHPDLTYSVLMPWVTGKTWFDITHKTTLTPEQSLSMAGAFAKTMAALENWRIAHCDISNGNVLFRMNPIYVELVDVEDLHAPKLTRPHYLPGGSPGYAHHTAPEGLWSPVADRFAAAVLLAEILGWCDSRVRHAKRGDQFFDPREMPQRDRRQPTSENFNLLLGVLYERWGKNVSEAFSTAWYSESLEQCLSLQQWAHIIGNLQVSAEAAPTTSYPDPSVKPPEPAPTGSPETPRPARSGWGPPKQLDTDGVTPQPVPAGPPPPTPAPPPPTPASQKSFGSGCVWVFVIIVVLVIIVLVSRL